MEQHSPDPDAPILIKPKLSYWRRLGGGSLSISILVHGVLLAVGVFWILNVIPAEPEKTVEFKPSGGGGNPNANKNQKKQQQIVKNVSRVAAKDVSSNFTLPDPEMSSNMSKLGALGAGGMQGMGGSGSGGGKGTGIGTGIGGGMGSGINKGAAPVFFGMEMRAQRVAYVVDFSQSMRADGRDVLMREELSKSVKALPDKTKYQLIFFSGPVWVAGDTVTGNTVEHEGKKYQWQMKTLWEWVSQGPLMKVDWLESSDSQRKKSLGLIKDTELVGGTDWESPLEIAMNMSPAPEVIFFMTDGAMEQRDMGRLAKGIAAKAKAKNIKINTVNMMVTDAAAMEALTEMAEKTGGDVTMVEQGGKVKKIKKKAK